MEVSIIIIVVFLAGFVLGRVTARKSVPCLLGWLAQGGVALAGPAEAVAAAAADLRTLDEYERTFQRYLWHPAPALTGQTAVGLGAGLAAQIGDFNGVLSYHVNQISRKGAIEPPVRVAFDLWRADIRLYGWDRETWEKLLKRNYIFVEPFERDVFKTVDGKRVKRRVRRFGPASWLPTEPIAFLIEQTNSKVPIVSAPWFLANTCRQLTLTNEQLGYGYYDWLGVKKPQDFLDLCKVRLQDSIALESDVLEVVDESGVSKQNRSIEIHDSITGKVAFTRDTDDETGAGNAIKNLRRDDYKAKAREWYIPLPNKLPGFMLSDDALKELQSSAPDFIGPDRSPLNQSIDGRIHVGIACLRCHAGEVLRPVNGWARKNFTVDNLLLNVPVKYLSMSREERFKVFEELKRQYIRLNFDNELNEQRQRYRQKIQEASGMDAGELARQFARAYHQYADDRVTLDQAARELGYTPEQVSAAFLAYGGLGAAAKGSGPGGIDPELGALVGKKKQPMKRLHWEESFADAMRIMLTYKPEVKP